jgi:hypothetical protein
MVFQDQKEHLIEPSDHISIDNNTPKKTVIACKDPSRKDTAMYSITVSNKHGTDSAEIEVVVLDCPLLNVTSVSGLSIAQCYQCLWTVHCSMLPVSLDCPLLNEGTGRRQTKQQEHNTENQKA